MKKIIALLESIAREGVYPIFPILVIKVLGLNILVLGLIEGLAEAMNLTTHNLLKFPKKGSKTLYLLFLSILCRPILGLAENGFILGILRIGERQRAKTYLDETYSFLGTIAGPSLAFLLLPLLDFNYKSFFILTSIPALIIVVILLIRYKNIKAFSEETKKITRQHVEWANLSELLFNLGTPLPVFLIVRAQEIGISTYFLPLLWALSKAFSYPFDVYGKKGFLFLRFLLGSFIYVNLAFISDDAYLWPLFILYGVYTGINKKIKGEFLRRNSPKKAQISIVFSPLISGVLIGSVWTLYTGSFAFSMCAGLTLIAGGFYMVSSKD